MHRVRAYVDTSVFGGVRDARFQKETERFWADVRRGAYVVLVSSVTLNELAEAPAEVQAVLDSLCDEEVGRDD